MYFIVVNPESDRGQSILRLPMLEAYFDEAGLEYEACITMAAMDAYEKTLEFCKRNPDCKGIIGIGGDGTIQEIAAAMADAFPDAHNGAKIPIPLGILPSAASNDFMLTLDGGKSAFLAKYKKDMGVVVENFFAALVRRQLRTIDLITAGGMAFLNIASVGLEAVAAQAAIPLKPKYGEHAYTITTIKEIMKKSSTPITVEMMGNRHKGQYIVASVCNAQYCGNGLHLAPSAKIDDGKITLCFIKSKSRMGDLRCFYTLLRKPHSRSKQISYMECDEVKLTAPFGLLCLDGNIYRREGEITFKALPKVLDLFV